MKRNKIIAIVSLVIIAGTATWFFGFRKKEEAPVLLSEKPSKGYISESVTATGTVQPVDTVAVGTQVSGTINKVYTDFNSVVKKGQLLAELDKTLFKAALDQSKANLAQTQSQEVYQEGNFNRQSQLFTVGAISKADYDVALASFNSSKAAVGSIEAQVQTAQKNLSLASIYSPIDGTVLSRNISEGQTVAASFSTPTLFSIAKDLTKMQVRAAVDEADIGNVTKDLRATFNVDAFLNDVFEGTVQEIRLSPSISANVVTYTTIIDAPNDDKKLKPGMTANITIFTKEVEDALLVPAKALKYSPDSSLSKTFVITPSAAPKSKKAKDNDKKIMNNDSYVWVREGNKLIQKKVKTGLNNNTQVEVLEGLSPDDEVVTGTKQVEGSTPKATTAQASPFMPKRPTRSRR